MSDNLNLQVVEERQLQSGGGEAERAIAEVKGSISIAKSFPRDREAARSRILAECARPALAESAVYAFPRGGEVITGPSIRLAEAMAQNWGNLQVWVREVDQHNGSTMVEVGAWDMETNTKDVRQFIVSHQRDTRGGKKALTDGRDIYEHVANFAARRKRAAILAILPGDLTDAAVKACEKAQADGLGAAPAEVLKGLVTAFIPYGITARMIEKRLGHNLEATVSAEILGLRRIYASLRDGMVKVDEVFPPEAQPVVDVKSAVIAKAAAK